MGPCLLQASNKERRGLSQSETLEQTLLSLYDGEREDRPLIVPSPPPSWMGGGACLLPLCEFSPPPLCSGRGGENSQQQKKEERYGIALWWLLSMSVPLGKDWKLAFQISTLRRRRLLPFSFLLLEAPPHLSSLLLSFRRSVST